MKLGNLARFKKMDLAMNITLIASCYTSSELGAIGLALTRKETRKERTKVIGCPIRELNGAVELVESWNDSHSNELYWEGWEEFDEEETRRYLPDWEEFDEVEIRRSTCSWIQNWGRNAGGAEATLLMAAIGEVFGLTGSSRFGNATQGFFHSPLPLAKTVDLAGKSSKKAPQRIWQETCDWLIKEYGRTQCSLKEAEGSITLYRGVSASLIESTLLKGNPMPSRIAESWTTDEDVAKYFATRHEGKGYILTRKINTKDIILTSILHACLNYAESEFLVASGGEILASDVSLEFVKKESSDSDSEINEEELLPKGILDSLVLAYDEGDTVTLDKMKSIIESIIGLWDAKYLYNDLLNESNDPYSDLNPDQDIPW